MGADALRGLLGEDGLNIDSVDETMEKIQTVLQDQKEVEDALHIGTEDMMDVDNTEVEQELFDLIEQEKDLTKTEPKQKDVSSSSSLPNSELSRLNQMFTSNNEPKKKKHLELAS